MEPVLHVQHKGEEPEEEELEDVEPLEEELLDELDEEELDDELEEELGQQYQFFVQAFPTYGHVPIRELSFERVPLHVIPGQPEDELLELDEEELDDELDDDELLLDNADSFLTQITDSNWFLSIETGALTADNH